MRLAAQSLDNGATSVVVSSCADAEELFLGLYQGRGYVNTTGEKFAEIKATLRSGKVGTYHWDEVLNATDPHGFAPHLQIRTFEGPIVRIFWGLE